MLGNKDIEKLGDNNEWATRLDLALLGIGEDLAVVEGDMQLGVLAVKIVLQSVEIACALPLAHGQVVEEIVAAGLGPSRRHL